MSSFSETFTLILSSGTLVAHIAIVFALIYLFIDPAFFGRLIAKYAIGLGLLVSAATTALSLFYSSVIGFAPCELCWWQRIFMFPQVIIFAVALYYQKREGGERVAHAAMLMSIIMSVIGGLIAAFQYYGQMFNPSLLSACAAAGISCSKLYFVSFGYITIPLMSLTSFAVLLLIAAYHKYASR